MDDIDLAQFVERMKTVKAAVVGDSVSGGASAEAHTIEVPYQSREAYLTRLEKDMYKDFMALDTEQIAAGQVTATQIEAAYEPLNEKADMYEYCIRKFVKGILAVFGIDDAPMFVRSKMSNVKEDIEAVISCADYLSEEYITRKDPRPLIGHCCECGCELRGSSNGWDADDGYIIDNEVICDDCLREHFREMRIK
jgi:hypothetical protein